MLFAILGMSIALQGLGVFLALRLIPLSRGTLAWLALSAAVLLMMLRRGLTFLHETGFIESATMTRAWVESIALLISILIVVALYHARTIFNAWRRTESALFQEKEAARITLQSIGDGVITTDVQGRIVYLNPMAEQLLGLKNEEVRGQTFAEVVALVTDGKEARLADPVTRCLAENHIVSYSSDHNLLLRTHACELSVDLTAAPMRDPEHRPMGAVVVIHDLSAIWKMAAQLSYQATHDPLTDLINRREFERRLEQALERARIDNVQHTLCYMDLDEFKVVNDTCGHVAGDALLKEITALLQRRVRSDDVLSRLGGDEFALLLYGCPVQKAAEIADGLREAIVKTRFEWGGKRFGIGVSVGVVPISADAKGLAEILSVADAACYLAKEQGRNQVYVLHPDDPALAHKHGQMEWVHRIKQALEEERLVLYCQPIQPVKGQQDRHIEILVRLRDDAGDIVEPEQFLPAAERFSLMTDIDRYVVAHTLDALAKVELTSGDIVGINISGQSLGDERFLDFVLEALDRTGINARNICFEITETAAVSNLSRAIHFITRLRAVGCSFALDDFGSGVSSFAYLKSLPVDCIKIDGSFVHNVLTDRVDRAVVQSVIEIGRLLSARVVAERVESAAVLALVTELGVGYVQGMAIGEAIPLATRFQRERQSRLSPLSV